MPTVNPKAFLGRRKGYGKEKKKGERNRRGLCGQMLG
jgi:hypothetical protein